MSHTPEDILKLSSEQNYTCMYTREELEKFSQEKLNTIYTGISELPRRRPWRSNRRK